MMNYNSKEPKRKVINFRFFPLPSIIYAAEYPDKWNICIRIYVEPFDPRLRYYRNKASVLERDIFGSIKHQVNEIKSATGGVCAMQKLKADYRERLERLREEMKALFKTAGTLCEDQQENPRLEVPPEKDKASGEKEVERRKILTSEEVTRLLFPPKRKPKKRTSKSKKGGKVKSAKPPTPRHMRKSGKVAECRLI